MTSRVWCRLVVCGAVGGLLAAVGCSDGGSASGGASCAAPGACGGELVGTWDITHVCVDVDGITPSGLPPECGGLQTIGEYSITGNLEFRADGTYTRDTRTQLSMSVRATDACIHALGVPAGQEVTYCDGVEQSLRDDGFTGSCSYGSGACSCSLRQDAPSTESGTWSTPSTGRVLLDGDESTYCVEGSDLAVGGSGDGGASRIDLRKR